MLMPERNFKIYDDRIIASNSVIIHSSEKRTLPGDDSRGDVISDVEGSIDT
jgi:hypothetical protein